MLLGTLSYQSFNVKITSNSWEMLGETQYKSYAKALVKMSACWNLEGTLTTLMSLWRTSSRRKLWHTSTCFKFEVVTGFCASCTAPWLCSITGKHGMILLGNIKRRIIATVQNCIPNSFSANVWHWHVVRSRSSCWYLIHYRYCICFFMQATKLFWLYPSCISEQFLVHCQKMSQIIK